MRITICPAARFLITSLLLLSSLAQAETISGKVIGDGDTIDVLDAVRTPHRIRLGGIDAPEKAQPFGARSKQHLSEQVFGKQVDVQFSKADQNGRPVGKVMVNGRDANLEQIRSGFAWHYKKYQKDQLASDRAIYAEAEISARQIKAGCGAIPNRCRPGSGATAVRINPLR